MTVTPPVLQKAKTIFVLAPGSKAALRADAGRESANVATVPARLVLNAIWLPEDAPSIDIWKDVKGQHV
jgi:6-phosphogluconolactonase/glucosamine-6-phosphate isomerase/deaminase